jgi:hypothetical protein
MERGSLEARRERLTQLVPKVGPVAFARDRVLPVVAALEPLLPEAGLVRGSILSCQGGTGLSVALAMAARASAAGSWLACVGVPSLGLRAADEVGIALERLVMVGRHHSGEQFDGSSWASMMAALIDGFDLIVLRGTPDICMGDARRLQARLQARGAVMIVVGNPGAFVCDVTITGLDAEWEGLGNGAGRLARRRLTLSATGRRSPRPRHTQVWLPGADGGIEPIIPAAIVPDQVEPDRDAGVAYRPTG